MSEKPSRVSPRKTAANRRNALMSTGPQTLKGKAYSRMNALKHGLFAMDIFVAANTRGENPKEYKDLLNRLASHYQPIGVAEELEVQRIAACWWRVHRAWRYENSEIAHEYVEVDTRREELLDPKMDTPQSSEHAVRDLLRRAVSEIEVDGKISDQLKREMIGASGRFQEVWALIERITKTQLGKERAQNSATEVESKHNFDTDRDVKTLLGNIRIAIQLLEYRMKATVEEAARLSYDHFAVPNADALDRLLRAEAAAERNLNRAMDRLERLQRRRTGETVPPPLSVRLEP